MLRRIYLETRDDYLFSPDLLQWSASHKRVCKLDEDDTACSRWILSSHKRINADDRPARFIKKVLEVLFLFHKWLYDSHQLFGRFHQLISIRRLSADLIHCRPRRPAHRNERWITADLKFSQYSIDGCRNGTLDNIPLISRILYWV